jgi:hypothetical protein
MDTAIEYMDFDAEPTLRPRDTLPAPGLHKVIASPAESHEGKRILRVDVHDAIAKSRIGLMHGLPLPVQFRRQGALDAWRMALCATPKGWPFGRIGESLNATVMKFGRRSMLTSTTIGTSPIRARRPMCGEQQRGTGR